MARKPRPKPPAPDREPLFPPTLLAEVEVEPELFLAAIDDLAEAATLPRRERPNVLRVALDSYWDFYGLDPDTAAAPEDVVGMAALAARIAAAAEVMEQAGIIDDGERLPAIAEAACAARLIDKDGRPGFQLLDFLAALARAEAAAT
jgi:hypothetical protein